MAVTEGGTEECLGQRGDRPPAPVPVVPRPDLSEAGQSLQGRRQRCPASFMAAESA